LRLRPYGIPLLYAKRKQIVNYFDLKGVKEMKTILINYRLWVGMLFCLIISFYALMAAVFEFVFNFGIFNRWAFVSIFCVILIISIPLSYFFKFSLPSSFLRQKGTEKTDYRVNNNQAENIQSAQSEKSP
jgi:hypothetical protein